MIGLLLVGLGTFSREIGLSLGKWQAEHKRATVPLIGFLGTFWSVIFLIIIGIIKNSFYFDPASIPTLTLRIILEILQAHIVFISLIKAERSTASFIGIGTIPLLLLVDNFLGYEISLNNIVGISIIILGLLFLFKNRGLNTKGIGYVLFTTINAVATISLYKYHISNFNSVETEQVIVLSVVLIYFTFLTIFKDRINPFKYLLKPIFRVQAISAGACGTLISFAYLFGAPSIITTAKRAFSIIFATLSGNLYFKEKRFIIKIIAFTIILIGLIFLVK